MTDSSNEQIKLVAACPECGNTTWIERDDGFECLACEEFSYPEDMILVRHSGEDCE